MSRSCDRQPAPLAGSTALVTPPAEAVRRVDVDAAEHHVAALIQRFDRIPRAHRSSLVGHARQFFARMRDAADEQRNRVFRGRAAVPNRGRPTPPTSPT